MKKNLILLCFLVIQSMSANAEEAYTGFYGVVNLVKSSNAVEISGADVKDFFSSSKYSSKQPVGIAIAAGYGMSFGDGLILSIGASRELNKPEVIVKLADNTEIPFASRFATSLYLEPGVKISKDTLLYGKIAFESINFYINENANVNFDEVEVNGVAYGLGLKSALNKNLFMQFEVKKTIYDKQSFSNNLRYEPSSLTGSFGMGFKF